MEQDSPIRIEARNISLHGLKFYSNRRIPLFEQVNLSFYEKKSGNLVADILAKVVRLEEIDIGVGERTYGISVEFFSGFEPLERFLPETKGEISNLDI
jgi:hypothetical protein